MAPQSPIGHKPAQELRLPSLARQGEPIIDHLGESERISNLRAQVDKALGHAMRCVERQDENSWSWSSAGAAQLSVMGILSDGWLLISVVLAGGHVHGIAVSRCAQDLLKCNARLESSAKLGLRPGSSAVEILAEIPLYEGVDLTQRLVEIDRDFELANSILAGSKPARPASAPEVMAEDAGRLIALFLAAGIHPQTEPSGPPRLPIKVDDQVLYTFLEFRRYITLRLPLGRWDNLSALAKQAIGTRLLEVGGCIRMGRASLLVSDTGGHTMAVLEAHMQSDIEPGQFSLTKAQIVELHYVLEAITNGARLCRRRFDELASDEEAVRFLSQCESGWRGTG